LYNQPVINVSQQIAYCFCISLQ